MLVEFRLRNFRSYAAEMRFSMVAGTGKELPGNTMSVAGFERHPLLRAAAVYGPNASGKSNLFLALQFFRTFILRSSEPPRGGPAIPVEPFLLDPTLADRPSEFEMTFLLGGVRHQYGFVASTERVHEEWLTVYPRGKPQEWFHREVDDSGTSRWTWSRTHLKGDKAQLADRTREDALFLSVAAQWNHEQIRPIHEWFRRQFHVLPRKASVTDFSKALLHEDEGFRNWLAQALRAADTGIHGVNVRKYDPDQSPVVIARRPPPEEKESPFVVRSADRSFIAVRTTRLHRDSGREIEWGIEQESDGTQRMFDLLGPIWSVLKDGATLIVDELDLRLHAQVSREVVRLFNDPATNPRRAQLIFTTHDTSLLDQTLLRRDQVWFTSRDEAGATELYSLQDYSPRKDEAIQKGYLLGRYGATPKIDHLDLSPVFSPEDEPGPVRR